MHMTVTAASFRTSDDCRIAYRVDGGAGRPVLVLSNSIATSLAMWDGQIAALTKHFRVVRYDARGHGESDVPQGPYSLDRLGRDALELLDELELERVHFLGLSLGGIVGQWLGIHAPERIDRLILSNTSPYLGPASYWREQIAWVQQPGNREAVADMFIRNWFPAAMRLENTAVVRAFRSMVRATDPRGIAGSFAALRDMDLRRTDALIPWPTLVIAGRDDTVTLPEHGKLIAETVSGAKLVVLPAVHLPNVECTDLFLDRVLAFLSHSVGGPSVRSAWQRSAGNSQESSR
jgi:3-oxoadipate enol-lactonase